MKSEKNNSGHHARKPVASEFKSYDRRGQISHIRPTSTVYLLCTGWLKIKYPTRQYAIPPQPVV